MSWSARGRRGARGVTAAGAAAVLLLAGCSGGGGDDLPTGPAVATLPASEMSLLVSGPVGEADREGTTPFSGSPVTANGCLGAMSGGKTYLVVWPPDTGLAQPDSDELSFDGEVLGIDGTFVGRALMVYREPFPEQFPSIPLRCLAANREPIVWLQEIERVSE